MRRGGFTMIELIFVIVILGILAAVAIPKLMATRTDAKISAVSQQVQSAIGEIPAYVTSSGKVKSIKDMSQVIATLISQNKATDINTSNSGWANAMSATMTGRIDAVVIGTQNDAGDMEDCVLLEVNATTLSVTDNNATGLGAICKGVTARIKDANYTIGGSSVTF